MKSSLKWVFLLALSVVVSFATVSCKRNPQNVQAAGENNKDVLLSSADQNFMKQAVDANLKERNLGRVMAEKTQNSDVRDYAQMIVDDHSDNLKNAIDLMNDKGIKQPQNMVEVKHEALARLSGMSGAELDREFVNVMIQDHQRDIARYQNEQKSAKDPAVRDYAAHTVPMLQKHLQKAQDLQRKLTESQTQK